MNRAEREFIDYSDWNQASHSDQENVRPLDCWALALDFDGCQVQTENADSLTPYVKAQKTWGVEVNNRYVNDSTQSAWWDGL